MKIDEDRLFQDLRRYAFQVDGVLTVTLAAVHECLLRQKCKTDCGNQARYDSGYCGVHDALLNAGQGKRIEIEAK